MISTKLPMTALVPSGFTMPISGAPFGGTDLGMAARATECSAPTYVVRDRHVAGVSLAQGVVPGSIAWSPPIC